MKTKANKYRTHNCEELRLSDKGKTVRLAGWVQSIRRLGALTFITLRDHYGTTQLLIKNENLLTDVNRECTLSAEGIVLERQSKNPKMATGDIEVEVRTLTVTGKCVPTLPFEIADAQNTKEDLRLKYRFLDLRNEELHARIVKRAKILRFVRNKMSDLGFTEVQTPILTSSSPEGARDYIVPTILAPGEFYALPQAPQQYKQLLMVSGFDKYFQIAPCFRNEEARADRTPGEFYQIDIEMSFATQEDVFEMAEDVAYSLYTSFTNLSIAKPPFKQIKFAEALEIYCTDKPDMRNPLLIKDYTTLLSSLDLFKGKTIKGVTANCKDMSRKFYDELSQVITNHEGKCVYWFKQSEEGLVGSIAKLIDENLRKELGLKQGESLILVAEDSSKVTHLAHVLRTTLGEKLGLIDKNRVEFCWVVDFPFYEYNEAEKKIDFSHNPFSMPQGGLEALTKKDPLEIYAYQYDLVCNGYEMLSGAVRNHDQEVMLKAFEIAGYNRETVENKFRAMWNAFAYGPPPHAGCAFGFDRMLMPLMEQDSIKEVLAFPMNKSGRDPFMNSPSKIDDKTLADLGLQYLKKR